MRRRGAPTRSSIARQRERSVAKPLPLALHLYQSACSLGSPMASQVLTRRLKRGKEHPERLAERLGEASLERPKGPLIWVHAASVGEMLAAVPLIERLRAQGFAVLVTSGTVTSATLAEQRLPDGVMHQFIPLDGPRFVQRFLDHWRPGLALFVESDLPVRDAQDPDDRDQRQALGTLVRPLAQGASRDRGASRSLRFVFGPIGGRRRAL